MLPAPRSLPQDVLAVRRIVARLGMVLEAAPITVQCGGGAHVLHHGRVACVGERALEVHLDPRVPVRHQRLHGVGCLPHARVGEEAPDARGAGRAVQVEEPVGDIDVVHHEIREDAAAEVPEPPPVAVPVGIERLFGRGELAARVFELPAGIWSGPLRSGLGWHLVRVTAHEAPRLPALAEIEQELRTDWQDDERAQRKQEALERLLREYRIVREGAAPGASTARTPAVASVDR